MIKFEIFNTEILCKYLKKIYIFSRNYNSECFGSRKGQRAIVYLWYESNFHIRFTEKASKTAKRRVERERASLYSEGEAFSLKHDCNHGIS